MKLMSSLPDSFWAKVEMAGDHWLWTGAHQSRGYGSFAIGGRTYQTHRLAWQDANGEIPDGLVIDHLCRVPSCVNPDHMELVTPAENTRRGAEAQRDTGYCSKGHDLAAAGLYETTRRDGRRRSECRECRRKASKRTDRESA